VISELKVESTPTYPRVETSQIPILLENTVTPVLIDSASAINVIDCKPMLQLSKKRKIYLYNRTVFAFNSDTSSKVEDCNLGL